MASIHLIVGSVMGTATGIAQEAAKILQQQHKVRVNQHFSVGDLRSDEPLLICTSSTGLGDLPSNIAPLLEHLQTDKPDLNGIKYSVINLGDSHYPNFGGAGRRLDQALTELGAINTLIPLQYDASEGEPSLGELKIWLREWQATL